LSHRRWCRVAQTDQPEKKLPQSPILDSLAVVIDAPKQVALRRLTLDPMGDEDVLVEIDWSSISAGTEKLLWSGTMPPFPGMGYPLVPGYEAVGRITDAIGAAKARIGQTVFVPGARCFGDIRGLFGGNAARVVLPAARAIAIDTDLGDRGVLLALAATAQHALAIAGHAPDLIIGHGVLGRLIARLAVAAGHAPVVWETNPARQQADPGYSVSHPEADQRRDYRCVIDASGDPKIIDTLVARLIRGGRITLAGFYPSRLDFAFAPAFMREASIAIAAEWQPADLDYVLACLRHQTLSLNGLITHRAPAHAAADAYHTAFGAADCLKLLIDWRHSA
jgi:3-hydroxyethyl bacteriochlorophyllide a dehydrogenase